jgi:hypothetical protein
MFWIAILGFFAGAMFGVLMMASMFLAKQADNELEGGVTNDRLDSRRKRRTDYRGIGPDLA